MSDVYIPHQSSASTAQSIRTGAAWTFAIAATVFLPLTYVTHRGLAPLFVICALAAFIYWLAARDRIHPGLIGVVFIGFGLMAVASTAWSYTPSVSLKTSVSFIGTLLGTFFMLRLAMQLESNFRHKTERFCLYGGILGFVILMIDSFPQELSDLLGLTILDYRPDNLNFWNERKTIFSAATIFFWPWAYLVWIHLKRPLAVALLGTSGLLILLSAADTAKLAIIAGVFAAAAVRLAPFKSPRAIAALAVASVIVIPLLVPRLVDPLSAGARYDGFSASAIHRIAIWQVAAEKIADHPIFGLGFDTTRALYPPGSGERIRLVPASERSWEILSEPIPLHPHNVVLQIWIEMGALGAIFFAAIILSAAHAIDRASNDNSAKAMGFAALTSVLVFENLSFGAWQAWWLAAMAIVATLTALVIRPR